MHELTIFYNTDTQNDFMNKDGALYVPDAELIRPNLRILTQYAATQSIPVFGSADRHFGTPEYKHRETELQKNKGPFPYHCMDRTPGQRLIPETTISNNPLFIPHDLDGKPNEYLLELAIDELDQVYGERWSPKGVYFEKQSYDVFTNPNAEEFFKKAKVDNAVVYGVATDYCVKAAVLGMQRLGIQCYVIKEAVRGVEKETTQSALEEITQTGAKFVAMEDVLEGRLQ